MQRRDLLPLAAGSVAAALPRRADAAPVGGPATGLRVFDVRQFGAAGDGKTLDTSAINNAIDAAHLGGGGVAYLSPGTYLSGTVVLKSNVTLYLEAGSTFLGSRNLSDYTPQSGPPLKGDANQKHLIFARAAENVGLAGPGRIDGQGSAFWVPSGRKVPPAEDAWRDVATYDWKPLDRPSPLIEFAFCKHLRIEDVRIENASGWTLRPINCENVVIRGITIHNPVIGPNTDGIDPTGCRNVFISDCYIDTGDDAICLKSENPYGGEPQLSKNITITNCVLTCCCNGLKFGTATRGGFENVTFTNSVIFNENVDFRARVISGIALEMVDGGWLDGVVISDIRMQRVRTPIFVRRGNRHPRPDGTPGTVRGIMIENVHATGAILTSSVTGLPGFPVEDVTLSGIRIDSEEAGHEDWVSRTIPEVAPAYPEARMFGRLPASGFYCRHVNGLRMKDVVLGAAATEARPAIVCENVTSLDINGLKVSKPASGQPVVSLRQTRDAWLRGCSVPEGTSTFLGVSGNGCDRILLSHSDLRGSEKPFETGEDVRSGAVVASANVTRG